MKNKKSIKKLSFKKETVTNLCEKEQNEARGGRPFTSMNDRYMCYTWCNTTVCCMEM